MRLLRVEGSSFDYKKLAQDLFTATRDKLNDKETEQDIKEASIACMSMILAHLGDDLGKDGQAVLPTLIERVQNEVTSVAAIKGFETIASSQRGKIDISPILGDLVTQLTSLLAKV